ncbi:energy transducer TonB [Chryseobacterium sp. MEBOG06]|uniref:energy transducer TonB n=1 Tax=unclassified Chryseobacterium TaxID=2593645 RepID=UPI001F3E273D|nr:MULTISPECIES: energy transducer TonB [unclassified Chryseobacterium]UKB83274.1 energy transducer TonB [Chryseobacterium sp. MEBOG06]
MIIIRKFFSLVACTLVTAAFAQNTRATLRKTVNSLYSDIRKKCGKDIEILDEKYKAIAGKSPNGSLSKADEQEYTKQFNTLKSSYSDCQNKNQPQKVEKLKSLLEQVEKENKEASSIKNNSPSSAAQPFSPDIIRNEVIKAFSGSELLENQDAPLKLRFNFIVDKDGIMKEVKVTGTDNEEIKLFSALNFYSIQKVFLPEMKNGEPIRNMYSLPVTLAIE